MYCEILSDKVIDISMFIKEKCVSENCNYIYSVDFNSNYERYVQYSYGYTRGVRKGDSKYQYAVWW